MYIPFYVASLVYLCITLNAYFKKFMLKTWKDWYKSLFNHPSCAYNVMMYHF